MNRERSGRPDITDLPVTRIEPVIPNGPRKINEVPIERTIDPEDIDDMLNPNKKEEQPDIN